MRKHLFGLFSLLVLSACGDTVLEQSLLGAGAGLGTAAVLDGNLAAGAAIGAAGNVIFRQTKRSRC
jgi:hypothetical protein